MLAGAAVAALLTGGLSSTAFAADKPAPLLNTQGDVVEGSYVVALKKSGASALRSAVSRAGGTVTSKYSRAVTGYTATLTAKQLAEVRTDPAVAYVEPNRLFRRSVEPSDGGTRQASDDKPAWGLDRIDQRALKIDRRYFYESAKLGTGVTAYVIDDGVQPTNKDFRATGGGSRVVGGYNATDDPSGLSTCRDEADAATNGWGHGTHVAGILAGKVRGIARAATVVPVKVFPCPSFDPSGTATLEDIVEGLDWVAQQHQPGTPAVANMSLGAGASDFVDEAVDGLIADGVTVVVAAGNVTEDGEDPDACHYSPARVPRAITVGAMVSVTESGKFDPVQATIEGRPDFSFFGSCLDIFAPGVGISSANYVNDDDISLKLDGTSMASPAVAGVAAAYLGAHPAATPAQVRAAIVGGATTGTLLGIGAGSPNRLLYSPLADAPPQTASKTAITSGTALNRGTSIKSPNGLYTLTQQTDGNLVLTKPNGRVLWALNRRGTWTKVDANGNLRFYDYAKALWGTGATSGPAELRVQNDANLVTYRLADNAATWASKTAQKVAPPQVTGTTDTAQPGQALYRGGAQLKSANGRYRAYVRLSSGRLVVLDTAQNKDIFVTPALDSDWLSVQSDGNAVLYRSNGTALWSSGTGGRGASRLVMQNDGNLVLYRGSTATWSSKGGRA